MFFECYLRCYVFRLVVDYIFLVHIAIGIFVNTTPLRANHFHSLLLLSVSCL